MKIIQAALAVAFAAVASASDAQGQAEYLRGPSADVAAVTADAVLEDDTPRPVIVDKVSCDILVSLQVVVSTLTL